MLAVFRIQIASSRCWSWRPLRASPKTQYQAPNGLLDTDPRYGKPQETYVRTYVNTFRMGNFQEPANTATTQSPLKIKRRQLLLNMSRPTSVKQDVLARTLDLQGWKQLPRQRHRPNLFAVEMAAMPRISRLPLLTHTHTRSHLLTKNHVSLSLCLAVSLALCLSVYVSVSLSLCLSFFFLSLSLCLSIPMCRASCLPLCLSVCISASLSLCLSVSMRVSLPVCM